MECGGRAKRINLSRCRMHNGPTKLHDNYAWDSLLCIISTGRRFGNAVSRALPLPSPYACANSRCIPARVKRLLLTRVPPLWNRDVPFVTTGLLATVFFFSPLLLSSLRGNALEGIRGESGSAACSEKWRGWNV